MSDTYGPSVLAISTGIGLFQNFLPKLTDIRRADANSDTEFAADVRLGEAAATAVLVGIGITTASITGSSMPLIIAIGTAMFLVLIYEYTLMGRPFSGGTVV